MRRLHPRVRLRLAGLALTLVVVTLSGVACVPAVPGMPAAGPTQAAPVTVAPAATSAQPAPNQAEATAVQPPAKHLDLPVGVDAAGNFYRGNINAPVKLVEYSDFQ